MIVKVQLPIVSSESAAFALIYNEERTLHLQVETDSVQHLFNADELKVYYKSEIVDGELVFKDRVASPDW